MALNSRDIATISCRDIAREEDACLIVRIVDGGVALCISLKSDGDIETILTKDTGARLVEALQKALADV
jgi:hypothetical protein